MDEAFLPIALSPCPNDTFLFHAWIHGLVGTPPNPTFADIQELNQFALKKSFPLLKASLFCYGKVRKDYTLLPVGAALGDNFGPKIIARAPFSFDELKDKKIAIPGVDTTAHFLFDALGGKAKEKTFCLYHEIESLLRDNKVDCGIIIHESRFTFQQNGFYEIADLGTLWKERFNLPLPLGGILARRDFSSKQLDKFSEILRDSLLYAKKNPSASFNFILEKSQEKNRDVIEKHIALYVTKETLGLSSLGVKAIDTFLKLGEKLGYF